MAFLFGVYLCVAQPARRCSARRAAVWGTLILLFCGLLIWSAMREFVTWEGTEPTADGQVMERKQYANFFGDTRTVTVTRPRDQNMTP